MKYTFFIFLSEPENCMIDHEVDISEGDPRIRFKLTNKFKAAGSIQIVTYTSNG